MKPLVLELDGNGGYLIVNLHSIKIMNVAERIIEIEFKGNDKPRRYMLKKPLDVQTLAWVIEHTPTVNDEKQRQV